MKYIPLAVLYFTLILAGCIEVGDSGSNPIQGEVVERRSLTDEEIAILDGLDVTTFNRALRHEEIHYILFFETGSSDGGHKSIWFDIEESPCPETGQ